MELPKDKIRVPLMLFVNSRKERGHGDNFEDILEPPRHVEEVIVNNSCQLQNTSSTFICENVKDFLIKTLTTMCIFMKFVFIYFYSHSLDPNSIFFFFHELNGGTQL